MSNMHSLSAEQFSRYQQFELLAHSVVEGLFTGLHRSPYKGFAVEFAEHRQYTPGDDFKYVDWKLFGKYNRFYVRQFQEDTCMRAWLLLDASGSMTYQSGDRSKLDVAKFICGVFAYVLHYQNDSVGLLSFDRDVLQNIMPAMSNEHFKRILDTLARTVPGEDTLIAPVLHRLAVQLKRRSLVVIVSDFFDDLQAIDRALNHFAKRKHQVIICQVIDKNEATFPFTQQTRFDSLERGTSIMTDPIRIRREYLRRFNAHQKELRAACHRLNMEYCCFVTDQPFERNIARFLAERTG
jgi:uncharacterized protein (DUF58 family)